MAALISIFTPSHDARFLDDCYESLVAQSWEDWQWVVLLNGGAKWQSRARGRARRDKRVIVRTADVKGVGAAKAAAVAHCEGELLVELDHDDRLAPSALERVAEAFSANPGAGLVYSHCGQVTEDGKRDTSRFDTRHGWAYREADVGGLVVDYPVSLAPTAHNVSLIWYSPNHLRAFSRRAYDAAGGYDPARTVLDDQDLMCRLYGVGPFVLIDECLYLQRLHPANTQRDKATNAQIQRETLQLYDRYVEANALAWARREGLLALDLGSLGARRAGFLGVDRLPGLGADVVAELPGPLPFADSSCGVVRAVDFLEHVADKVALINEIHRLLAPGGLLLSLTPSTDGRGAFQDPTHVAFYNEHSFWYYCDPAYARYVPAITARFQVSRLATGFPSAWHQAHNVSYVTANLVALKGVQPRNGGLLAWPHAGP